MQNKVSIRLQQEEVHNFSEILDGIKNDSLLRYFLEINEEEVEITKTMAFALVNFFEEFEEHLVLKFGGTQNNPYF